MKDSSLRFIISSVYNMKYILFYFSSRNNSFSSSNENRVLIKIDKKFD